MIMYRSVALKDRIFKRTTLNWTYVFGLHADLYVYIIKPTEKLGARYALAGFVDMYIDGPDNLRAHAQGM
jgi:hypothetical protein